MSYSNEYMLVVVEYASKWVEIAIVKLSDAKIVIKFLKKNIFFFKFGSPRMLISEKGTHFFNIRLRKVLAH